MPLYIVATYRPEIEGRAVEARVSCGLEIRKAIEEAIDLSKKFECAIEFTFNGKLLFVYADSDANELYRKWNAMWD